MVLILVVGLPAFYFISRGSEGPEQAAIQPNVQKTGFTLSSTAQNTKVAPPESFRPIAAAVLPVVVEVDVVDVVTQQVPQYSSPFNFLFGPQQQQQQQQQQQPQQYKQYGLGSGVVVKKDGNKVYVLTNNHVAGNADKISVKLYDGRQFTAKLVGADANRDLALIEFESSENIPVAKLGDSSQLAPGDWVLAIGNPLGFESTVTAGIVSAVGRQPTSGSDVAQFTDYIQTDAAINEGNSGGALVNINGEVVGINSWIASNNGGGSIGIGFAIPINNAKSAINDFITKGRIDYGWLGINLSNMTAEGLKELNVGKATGSLVNDVFLGSPAAKAGIEPGDYVTKIGDQTITDSSSLLYTVSSLKPGDTVPVDIVRYGKSRTVQVKIGTRADSTQISNNAANLWPGLTVIPLTKDISDQLGVSPSKGKLIVAAVENGSPAGTAGLRAGDILVSLDGKDIGNLEDFYKTLNSAKGNMNVSIIRNGMQGDLTLNK